MPPLCKFEEPGVFAVPEDVPELGVKAEDPGVIADVYESGRVLDLEIALDDGTSTGFVGVRLDRHGIPHVVGYSPL